MFVDRRLHSSHHLVGECGIKEFVNVGEDSEMVSVFQNVQTGKTRHAASNFFLFSIAADSFHCKFFWSQVMCKKYNNNSLQYYCTKLHHKKSLGFLIKNHKLIYVDCSDATKYTWRH